MTLEQLINDVTRTLLADGYSHSEIDKMTWVEAKQLYEDITSKYLSNVLGDM